MGNRTKAQSFVRFFSSSAGLMALAVTAAACSTGGGTAIPQGTQSTGRVSSSAFARLSSQSNAAASAAAQGSNPLIYAADAANNAIYVYNNVPNSTPTRVITTGINNPQGITVDSGGNLYVANAATNDVLVYAPGSGTPNRTYSQGLNGPSDVAVSTTGELYVTNTLSGNVVVYPPGSTTPSITWQSPVANTAALGIALQTPAGGDAYVSYESPSGGGLLSCAIGSATCAGTGISVPGAFALAPQYNATPLTLFVSDIRNNVVDVFHVRHGKTPAAQIHTSGTPYATALDSTFTHLYVANQTASGGLVNEYAYPGGTPLITFVPPKNAKQAFLTGVALYPSATTATTPPLTANLFVANKLSNSVSTFDTAAGNAALTSITGGGLNAPYGATLDATGKLFVANPLANSVSIFDTVNGNALLSTITSGLNVPTGVTLDAVGNLYVVNSAANSVSVFLPNNYAAPATFITGNGLTSPAGIAFDPATGTLLVANAGANTVTQFQLQPASAAGPLVTPTGFFYQPAAVFSGGGLSVPQGVAIRASVAYVANSGNDSVSVIPLNGAPPAPPITGNGLSLPEGVAIDASGKLYVTNFGANSLSVFDTTNGNTALTTITGGGLDGPTAVAVH